MIGKLTGIVDSVYDGYLILDVAGVGYRVFCSGKTLAKMPATGGTAGLLIETQVREDHIHLMGFSDATEKQAYTLLSTVQGVGSKVALAILSALSPNEIQMAVMTGDGKAFTRASGVGPKLGTRIVSELKGKMGALGSDEITIISSGVGASVQHNSAMDDAISALSNLGYARIEAGMVVANVLRQNPDANTSELIRLSLKEIGKGSL